MADQEIDRLLLEIEVEDKTQGGSKKLVDEFATAISKLQAEINKLDVSKLEAVSKALSFSGVGGGGAKGTSAIGKQSEEVKKLNSELKNLQKTRENILKQKVLSGSTLGEVLGATYTDKEGKTSVISKEAAAQLSEQFGLDAIDKQIEEVQTKLSQAQIPQAQGGMGEQLKQVENVAHKQLELNSLRDVQAAQLDIINRKLQNENLSEEEQVRLKKQALSLEKAMANTGEKSLFTAIKRVSMYRLIRAAIKFVVDALKEGAEQIAQISPEFNKTWSSVLTSMDKIKGALATIGVNLLPIIEPILRIVADLLVTVSNTIGKILAAFNGTGKAIQANTKHQRDYNKELKKGALLSFDTFTTLKAQEQSDLYSVEDTGELGSGLAGLIDSITPIMNFVNELITTITDVLMPIIVSVADVVDGVVDQIKGAFKMIAGLLKLLTGDFEGAWDLIGEGFVDMVNGIANMFIALGKFIIDALNFLFVKTNPLFWILKSAGIDVGGKIESWNADWSAKAWNPIKNHAFGGDYNSADLFYANENGQTELIASTNSGGGAVMNMQQLESAIYSGMVKAMASGENGESAIYLDGNKVGTFIAGNNGFRSEANRRNTGLNWR